jgi:hypothetical protein
VRILALLLLALLSAPALAEGSITIGFIGQDRPPVRPVWPLNRELRDVGLMGARLGLADTATTGRFTGQPSPSRSKPFGSGTMLRRLLACSGIGAPGSWWPTSMHLRRLTTLISLFGSCATLV